MTTNPFQDLILNSAQARENVETALRGIDGFLARQAARAAAEAEYERQATPDRRRHTGRSES